MQIEQVVQITKSDSEKIIEDDFIKKLRFNSTILMMCPICGKLLKVDKENEEQSLRGFNCSKCNVTVVIKYHSPILKFD